MRITHTAPPCGDGTQHAPVGVVGAHVVFVHSVPEPCHCPFCAAHSDSLVTTQNVPFGLVTQHAPPGVVCPAADIPNIRQHAAAARRASPAPRNLLNMVMALSLFFAPPR